MVFVVFTIIVCLHEWVCELSVRKVEISTLNS